MGVGAEIWFGSFNKDANINGPKKSFQTFRHSFVDYLKSAKSAKNLMPALMDHADNSITAGRYGTGEWDLNQLSVAINKLPPHWKPALNRFMIEFEEQLTPHI
jgi:hypothetical protein